MALGVAIHFNRPLSGDPGPLERLLSAIWGGATVDSRFGKHVYGVPGVMKLKSRSGYERDRILEMIRDGGADMVLLTPRTVPEEGGVFDLSVDCASPDRLPDEAEDRPWRYQLGLAIGSRHLEAIGHDAVVTSVLATAEELDAVAGVIFPASSDNAATALVTLAGGDGLPREVKRRIRPLLMMADQWGDTIRGPEWGTLLSAKHVDQLGGIDAVTTMGTWTTRALSSGGAYVQLTPSPDDMDKAEGRQALEQAQDKLAAVMPEA